MVSSPQILVDGVFVFVDEPKPNIVIVGASPTILQITTKFVWAGAATSGICGLVGGWCSGLRTTDGLQHHYSRYLAAIAR
jgi:hypothetical protein